jgi:hypothetical protein
MSSKFKSSAFAEYEISVDTARPLAVFEPFPRPGRRGVFAGDSVRIESGPEVVAERSGAREAFFGLGRIRRTAWWDDLDALYFAGYAMWNYLNTPFLLVRDDVEVREGEQWWQEGETWRRLHATFPEGFHTHCREQTFYFDRDGLLRRHDYAPDVISPLAKAVHMCHEHKKFDGFTFPTRRVVTPRSPRNRPLRGPTLVWISLADIRVTE